MKSSKKKTSWVQKERKEGRKERKRRWKEGLHERSGLKCIGGERKVDPLLEIPETNCPERDEIPSVVRNSTRESNDKVNS